MSQFPLSDKKALVAAEGWTLQMPWTKSKDLVEGQFVSWRKLKENSDSYLILHRGMLM